MSCPFASCGAGGASIVPSKMMKSFQSGTEVDWNDRIWLEVESMCGCVANNIDLTSL